MISNRLTKLEKLIGTDAGRDSAPAIGTPAMFRQSLLIETDSGLKPLAEVLDDWQRIDHEALDDGLLVVAGRQQLSQSTITRAFWERGRGHGKTTDLAIVLLYTLAAAVRPIVAVISAADSDQARLIRHAAERLVQQNPWLGRLVEIQGSRIIGQAGAVANFVAADVGSSFGWTPDLLIVDEVTHHGPSGERMWHSLFSSAAKRPGCVVLVATNAGCRATNEWQWSLRENARTSPGWYFHALDGIQASWLSERAIAEQRRMLPPQVFDRLWENRWQTGGNGAIAETDLQAALRFDDKPSIVEPGAVCFAGVDLATSRDTAAVVIVSREANGCRVSLVDILEWTPTPGRRIQISDIEQAIIAAHAKYNLSQVAIDSWNASLLVERLGAAGVSVAEVPATAANLRQMADALLNHLAEGTIALWPHDALVRDLRALQLVERGSSWRLESPRDGNGHGDRASALQLSLLAARSKPQCAGILHVERGDVPSFASLFSVEERERLGIGG
jgi:hypothetical protein